MIDRIQQIDDIIFDKTGTITDHKNIEATISGPQLTPRECYLIKSAVYQSNHPLSKAIFSILPGEYSKEQEKFKEITGQGITSVFADDQVRVGSPLFIEGSAKNEHKSVVAEVNGHVVTWFSIEHKLREGVEELVETLGKSYSVTILSGDNDKEEARLKSFFPQNATMTFHQTPLDKLNHIKQMQAKGRNVMMIGDGLNDAGALMQSNVGIVISEDSNNFTPACDAILGAKAFPSLLSYLTFLKKARWIIIGAFVLAFLYNVLGLYFAVRGELSPVVAAILMPISSITVMVYGLLSSTLVFRKMCR